MQRKNIAAMMLGLVLCIVLLSGCVLCVVYFTPFYGWNIKSLQLEEATGLSREELQANYNQIIHYNNPFVHDEMDLPDFELTEEFREHFRAVKAIFNGIWACCLVGMLILLCSIYWIRKYRIHNFLLWAPIFQVLILAGAGIGMTVGWERFFTLFHEIAFSGQQWMFDPVTDPLILILPENWFLYCFLLILALYILSGIICFGIWAWNRKKH